MNDHLHKTIQTSSGHDRLVAYDYIDEKEKVYVWSDVRRRMQRAFGMQNAARLVNRSLQRVRDVVYAGNIKKPQRCPGKWGQMVYKFSEDDIMNLWEWFAGNHIGRPRNDGRITNNSIPSREQVKMMMRTGKVLYVEEDGEFVPIWRANEW